MTFYNVISALLFVGAFREFVLAMESCTAARMVMASCLALVVVNDMLSTSSLVEAEKLVTYDQSLMMIDLLNFMLLAFALIVLNPEDNLFNAKVPRIGAALSEAGFWALLGVYWLLLIHWTFRAKLFEGIGRPLLSLGVALGFIIQALAVTYWSEGAEVIQFIVIAYVLFYFGTRLLPSH